MLFVPFLAATAASEAIALDLRSRALRYEALRAGRAEILLGRFAGQLLLAGVAMAASLVGVWTLGVTLSSDPQPLGLAWDW